MQHYGQVEHLLTAREDCLSDISQVGRSIETRGLRVCRVCLEGFRVRVDR